MASIGSLKIGIGLNTTGLIRDLKRSEFMLKKQGSKFKALGASLTSSITLPLLAAGGAGATLAVQLGDNFAKIENLVGVTGSSLEDLRSGVARVSGQTAKSQVELSEALFAVTSAGLRGKDAINVLTQAAKASQVGLGETKSIALASTAVLNAYGSETISAARATDVLAATIKYGNLEAASLAPVLGKVIGPASQLGISFEEIGANVATFTRLGTGAEEAVTALGSVMNTFIKVTPQASKALAEVGLTAEGVRDKIKTDGLADTLIFLTDTFDGNIEALAKVIPNVKALGNVLGTASAQGTTYKEVVDGIYDSTGLVDEGFKNVSKTAGFQLKKALVDVQNAAIGLGNKLLPIVLKIVGLVSSLVNKFTSLSSATQDTVVKFALIAAAAGPVLSVFGGLIGTLGSFKGLFAAIIPNIVKFWAALTGPVGLAAIAFGSLAVLIVNNWDKVKTAITAVVNSVIKLYNENVLVRGVIEGIVAYWNILKRTIAGIFTSLKSLGSVVKKIFTGDFDSLGDLFKTAGDEIKAEATSYAEDVKNILVDAVDNTIDPKEMIKPITEADVQSFVDPLVNGIKNATNGITGLLSGGGGGGGSSSSSDSTPDLSKKIAPLASLLPSINSEVIELGNNLDDGLDGGKVVDMVAYLKELKSVSIDLGETLKGALGDALIGLGDNLGNAIANAESFGEGFKSVVTGVLDTLIGVLSQVGKLAISTGVAVIGIKLALDSLNPAAAIAGGVALVALASVVKAKLANSAASAPKLAKGGVLTGETLFIGGEYPGAATNPEIVTPENLMRKIFREEGAGGGGHLSAEIHMDMLRFGMSKDVSRVS